MKEKTWPDAERFWHNEHLSRETGSLIQTGIYGSTSNRVPSEIIWSRTR
jgi:hypothetical protein